MPVLPKSALEDSEKNGGVWLGTSATNGWSCGNGKTQGLEDDSTQVESNVVNGGTGGIAHCCVPSGCPNYYSDPIYLNDLENAVKVSFNL